jgi:hypothetical protein
MARPYHQTLEARQLLGVDKGKPRPRDVFSFLTSQVKGSRLAPEGRSSPIESVAMAMALPSTFFNGLKNFSFSHRDHSISYDK